MATGPAPTGLCFCGCRKKVGDGSFFVAGHDKTAESALVAARYQGSIAHLLWHHGFDSEHAVRDAAVRDGKWERCSHEGCGYIGARASILNHTMKDHHRFSTK